MQRARRVWQRAAHAAVACAVVMGAACGRESPSGNGGASGADRTGGAAVDEYLEFATQTDSDPADGAAFAAEGLRTLAGALGELGLGGPDLAIDLRIAAEHVLLNASSAAATETVRDAMRSVADALGDQEGEPVRAAAGALMTDQPLDAQTDAVAQCFRAAGGALERRR